MSVQTDNFTEQRIIAATPTSPNEEAIERALRPKQLDEYVGQEKIRDQLQIFITAARNRAITRAANPSENPAALISSGHKIPGSMLALPLNVMLAD